MGRQPWIVQDLLLTRDAPSPNVGTAWIWTSLTVFILLYAGLGVVDFLLMRRYARPQPAVAGDDAAAEPVLGY